MKIIIETREGRDVCIWNFPDTYLGTFLKFLSRITA
jgi:hypothetical protein